MKDFLKAEKQHQLDLAPSSPTPIYTQNLMAIKILERFREKHTYMGIVVDNFGSTIGMITMHDLSRKHFW